MRNKAVFLDRDGTIARDIHYCRSPEDFELLPAVPEAIGLLNANNFRVVVITNQSGIARGYFTEETLERIHKKMGDELKKYGARVDAIYYCPHHPDDGCDCRKPKTALFQRAAKEIDIDLSRSFVVGDMQMDIDAGKAIGSRTVLVTTGPQGGKDVIDPPDYTANSLLEAAQWVIAEAKPVSKPSQPSQSTTSIIMPAYNEEEGLPVILEKIFRIIDDSYEVIVVDDGSTDRTAEVASQFTCRLIRHEKNLGKGKGMETGVANAQGENIIFIDADNTYPVEVIPDIAKLLGHFDMVATSRVKGRENIPLLNRIGNFVFSCLIRYLHGSKVRDPLSGLYGLKRVHFEGMHPNSKGFAIETEIAIKAAKMGLKVTELPIQYNLRLGRQKLGSLKDGWKILKVIVRERFGR